VWQIDPLPGDPQLLTPDAGSVRFRGREIAGLGPKAMRPLRSEIQMIFQDPYASLNPRRRVGQIIGAPMKMQGIAEGADLKREVHEVLERVGLSSEHYNRYPHEFSGGQRQRIGIARALALRPKLIIADEPVSALDVSIQAQIINLLEDLQSELGLTYLFIAHDLAVVRHISDRVAVMYLGKIAEITDRRELYENPRHPYTKALLAAVPIPDPVLEAERTHSVLIGEVPSPLNPPPGCVFHPRCPIAVDRCRGEVPPLREISPGHWAACLLA
jgi:oligopeptide transport system ATP-binding protein